MSSIRFDRSQQPESMGLSRSRKPRDWEISRSGATALAPSASDASRPGSGSFLSVVIPARNEAASLPQLVGEIVHVLRPLCARSRAVVLERPSGFEIIVVDDGSTDTTPLVLERLARVYPELRPIRLSANVGQSAATAAGFRAARGTWVATLDADMQNDPADLVMLWNALPGYDVALGWRAHRADVWSKRLISRLANRVRNTVLGQSIQDTGCSVRLFPRDLALRLPLFRGVHRFLGPLFLREGCRVVQVEVNHRPRAYGRSHYNLWNRSLRVIVDLIGVAWLLRRPVVYQMLGDDNAEARDRSLSWPIKQVNGKEAS
jgi:dolichol-phosphate mannosyltransferase